MAMSILGTGWIEVDKIARQETCTTIYNALERMPYLLIFKCNNGKVIIDLFSIEMSSN